MFDKLVDLIIQFIQFFQFIDIVKEWEGGVVLRFGKFHRIANPGPQIIWPFYIERVWTTGVIDEPMRIGPLSLTTKDDKQVVASALMVSIVEDVKKFLVGLEGGNAGAVLIAEGVLADIVQSHTFDELTRAVGDSEADEAKGKWSVATKLTNRLRKRLEKYGASVSAAQIIELAPARSIRLWGLSHNAGQGGQQ